MRKEEQPIVERLREGIDLRPDFFGEEPPVWAQDPLNNDMAEKCGRCGSWAEVVRPGKTQCPCCGDDDEPALRLEAADTLDEMLDALKAVSSDIHTHQGTISLGTLALVNAAIAKAEGGNNAG